MAMEFKGFVLSMVESALELSNNKIPQDKIEAILNIGKEMLDKPIELLEGVLQYFFFSIDEPACR